MRIVIVTPVAAGSTRGNGVTARRWQRVLTGLGHEVVLQRSIVAVDCELLVALHAKKSAAVIRAFRDSHPGRPVILAMTGTDLYRDLPAGDQEALAAVCDADDIVVLHRAAAADLPEEVRDRVWVILQSVPAGKRLPRPPHDGCQVLVLAHLRAEKDPLLVVAALAHLPDANLQVTLAGGVVDEVYAARARAVSDPRFEWVGERTEAEAGVLLRAADLLVVSSTMEGGANVVGEAIVAGVPILASAIAGNRGLLGADYPGFFPAGDAVALADLLRRVTNESGFRSALGTHLDALRPEFHPDKERAAWATLLAK